VTDKIEMERKQRNLQHFLYQSSSGRGELHTPSVMIANETKIRHWVILYFTDLLSLRLVGVAGVRINVMSSYSQQ